MKIFSRLQLAMGHIFLYIKHHFACRDSHHSHKNLRIDHNTGELELVWQHGHLYQILLIVCLSYKSHCSNNTPSLRHLVNGTR